MMKKYAFVVFTQPVVGRDDEYNRWYTDRHVPDVLKVAGFVSAQRFKLAQTDVSAPAPYLAIYEIQSDDVEATLDGIRVRAGTEEMPISPALDTTAVKTFLFEAVTESTHA